MKIRNGFVANSSSSCFILDRSTPGVDKILENCVANTVDIDNIGRHTVIATGQEALDYINNITDYWSELDMNQFNDIMETMNINNLVFLRESDEAMGGYLFCGEDEWASRNQYQYLYDLLNKLSLLEFEYH